MTQDRKKLLWLSSGAGIALVIGIIVMANVLSSFVYGRLDFSRGQVYSVSRASKRLIGALPDPVNITVYYSKELPPQYTVVKNYLRDLLKEYVSGSAGKVRTKYVEIGEDQKIKEEAARAGVMPVRFDIFEKDKYEQREGYLGLVIQYQDKKDRIPFLRDSNGLEYDLTSRIKLLASTSKPVIGFVSNPKSITAEGLESNLAGRLRTRFDLKDVDLSTASAQIPADIGALFLAGPTAKFTDKELFLLDQFLLRGKSLCVMINTKRIDPRAFSASPLDTGLLPFLKHHGFSVDETIVSDLQSQMVQIQVPQGPFMLTNIIQYPPLIQAGDLNQSSPITKGLDTLILPFASPIKIEPTADMSAEVLAHSSRASWASPPGAGFQSFNPFNYPKHDAKDLSGPFNLAAVEKGKFTPFFTEPPKGIKVNDFLAHAEKPGRLVVVGTSKILEPEYRAPEVNELFVMNLADWMAQDEDLISIRSKEVKFHPLREVSAGARMLVKCADLFLPSLLAIGIGLWRWRARLSRKLRHKAEYAAPAEPPVPQAA